MRKLSRYSSIFILILILVLLFFGVNRRVKLPMTAAAANSAEKTQTICSTPQFLAPRDYSLSDNSAVVVYSNDFNNDGKADLINKLEYGFEESGQVRLGMGSSGALSAPIPVDLGDAYLLQFADLDHDGNIDLVVPTSNDILIQRGHGDGTFELAATVVRPDAGYIRGVAAGDFNGDGKIDLAVSNDSQNPSRMYIYLATGPFTFNPPATTNFPALSIRDLNTADLDHDGNLDLVLSKADDAMVWIMYGNGNGTFGPMNLVRMYGDHLRIMDFNGDGNLDLTSAHGVSYITFGHGDRTFDTPILFVLDSGVGSGYFADMNSDGKYDLVVTRGTNLFLPGVLEIFAGDGLGNFTSITSFPAQPRPTGVVVADINADGKPDIAAVNTGDPDALRLWVNSCGDTSPHIRILGVVHDTDGFPLNGAFVKVSSAATGTLQIMTGSGGTAEFRDLPPGVDYTVTIYRSFYTFQIPSVTLPAPTTDQVVDFAGALVSFKIEGQVVDTGTQHTMAQIPVHLTGDNNVDEWTITDSLGRYKFEGIPPTDGWYFLTPVDTAIGTFVPTPVPVHPLLMNRYVSIGGRLYRFNIGAYTLRPDGAPAPFVVVGLQGTGFIFGTDQNGFHNFTGVEAGFDQTIRSLDVFYRVTPNAITFPFLTANQTATFRASLRPPADFDGDGSTDISVFRTSTGAWYVRSSQTGGIQAQPFGAAGDIPVPADYDGDQKADVAVFRPSDGNWYILLSTTGTFKAQQFGANGDIPVTGDFDREGRSDLAVFRPSTGTWYILPSYDPALRVYQWGTNGDQPFAGDFDGDSYMDIAVFRPSSGNWYIRTNAGAVQTYQFGAAGDRSLVGDFDGDNRSDIGVFRPTEGNWYIRQSSNSSLFAAHFGAAGDVPMAGDFDNDGKTDLTVFRPAGGLWFTIQSSNGAFSANQWGLSEDLPVPATYTH